MEEELDSIEKNETWEMVTPPPRCKPIGLKWVNKIKRNSCGDIVRYKARLVTKGYVQKFGIDYEEVFFSSGENGVGFAYRHPVPVSPDTVILLPISSTRYRHPVLDDGYRITMEFWCGTGC